MVNATKLFLLVPMLLLLTGSVFAQIPNPSFENWSNGDPTGWDTGNSVYTFVAQATSGHNGSSAAQGMVVNFGSFNLSASLSTTTHSGVGFAVSERYGVLRGWYKFTSVNGDMFMATYYGQNGSTIVGTGTFLGGAQTVFTEFEAIVTYPSPTMPNNGVITFSIAGGGTFASLGSTFIVDDLSLDITTDVENTTAGRPGTFKLDQNYPNPFNPTTNIVYSVPTQSHVKLAVYDPLGREVAVVVDQIQSPGRYRAVFNGSSLASGVYYYRLTSGGATLTKSLLLLK